MERLTQERFWTYQDRVEAARMVARARVEALRWARRMNTAKGVLLILAIASEVVGIGVLATVVVSVLS
jgi:hypothetical protein